MRQGFATRHSGGRRVHRSNCRPLLLESLEDRALLAAQLVATSFAPEEILIGLEGETRLTLTKDPAAKALQVAAARFQPLGLSRGEVIFNSGVNSAAQRLVTRWKLPAGKDVAALAGDLAKLPGVKYAEPNYIWTTAAITPNDPRFGDLWGLNNIGQSSGTADADIDAPQAWDITTGSSAVVVGIIDTGVDYNHPDLAANIWTNPGEIANGIDDDNNGYIDDLHGINAITGSGNPLDDNNHGTHVAGTIGAVGNNGVGVAGVNHHVSIIAAKFLSADGSGTTADAIECFNYLNSLKTRTENPVNVVVSNNSWGGGGFSLALFDAMKGPAGMAPILHAVAAGNSNTNNDASPSYPSSYDLPNIISVAASDRTDKLASFSSFGATSVDLAAPGVSILSTTPSNTYSTFNGTSMATPHVAGAAALIASAYPNMSASELKQALLDGTDPIGAIGTNSARPTLTEGRLNVYQSLLNLQESDGDPLAPDDVTPPAAITNLAALASGISSLNLTWTATGDDGLVGAARQYDLRYSTSPLTEANWSLATKAVGEPIPLAAGQAETFRIQGLANSTQYYVGVKARDNVGQESLLSNILIASTAAGTTIRSDGFESGLSQWTPQSPWGTSTASKHLGNASATDSPSGNYNNNTNSSLTSTPINLTNFKETQLSFWHRYSLEQNYDFGRVEVSINGGASWTTLASYTGTLSSFQKVVLDLSAYDSKPSLLVRFRLQSDYSIRADGWYVDDFEIVGVAGPGISVTPTTGLITTESGGQATFSVVLLGGPPTADVVVPLSSTNTLEGTLSAANLTFTPADWNVPKTVTITGVNDTVFDGDVAYTVVTGPATSADSRFAGINPPDVAVTNRDNELPPTKFYVVDDGAVNKTFEYGASGAAIENYNVSSGNATPRGAASTAAGDKLWVVDANKTVYVYNTSGGLLGSWTAGSLPANANVQGVATNGADVWIVDAQGDRVYRYTGAATRLTGAQNAATNFLLNASNRDPSDLVTDGSSLWVLNNTSSTDKVFKYNLAGTLLGSWTITGASTSPTGITLDPSSVSHLWIVDSNTDRIYQFNAAASRTSGSQSPSTSFPLSSTNTNPQGLADPPATFSQHAISNLKSAIPASHDLALLSLLHDLDSYFSSKRRR